MAGSAARSEQKTLSGGSDARERLVAAACDLFSRNGVQAVSVDAIIERSGVARQTMYRHFASKQDLVLAFLERREELWTRQWLQAEVARRASDPGQRLLAIFDVFDGWFRAPDFEGCSFINVMLEHPDARDPVHRAAAAYLAGIRDFIEGLARQAGIPGAEGFARQWHILMKGSIVAAAEGDQEAARRARGIAAGLLERAIGPVDGSDRAAERPRRRRTSASDVRASAASDVRASAASDVRASAASDVRASAASD